MRGGLTTLFAVLACQWPSGTIMTALGTGTQVIRTTDAPVFLSSSTMPDREFAASLDRVRGRLGDVTQERLLRRQRALFEAAGQSRDVALFDALLERRVGLLHGASCLDQLLSALTFTCPSGDGVRSDEREFLAFILRLGGELQVFYVCGYEGGVSGATIAPLRDAALSLGWIYERHLHNHPFRLDARDVVGTLIPSRQDLATYYRDVTLHGLATASITNGFETVEFSPEEVGDLARGGR